MKATAKSDSALYINRELSWLAFNERVLEEAADASVPLLERVRFLAIAASNLDEFFMVRVAGLKRAVDDDETAPDPAGMPPAQQLQLVRERARAQMETFHKLAATSLLPALAKHGIRLVQWSELEPVTQARLSAYFRERVQPVLTPLAIDASRPFPLLASLSLNLALLLEPAGEDPEARLAIVQVPGGLTRLVPVPDEGASFVLLNDVIRAHIGDLFPGQRVLETTAIRLSRDAELELDDEGGRTHLEIVERELRLRRRSDIVRLEIESSASKDMVERLCRQLDVEDQEVYSVEPPVDLRVLGGIADLPGFDQLRNPPHEPAAVRASTRDDLFAVMEEGDQLLHHPYDTYSPVVALLAQAAEDPDVLAIKQTLYRVSANSPFVASLRKAAERNKQVTVLVEVTARFDEERNIQWARSLEAAGAHVIYGVRGYKTHAKLCLIVRRTPHGLRRYVHLSTGNYNERTARLYTDFGLLTTAPAICEDVAAIFNALTGYSDPPRLKKLVMAPTDLRRRLLKLIDRERHRAESGQPAEIVAKMNALIDREIIEALVKASRAGVEIRLNVRGICALRPGVKGATERIEVISIVDRFLEHSRMYYFLNGGADELYLASADWMTRNLDRRIEVMFPVEDPDLKRGAIATLRAMFQDNTKARRLESEGTYRRQRPRRGEPAFRVQEYLRREAQQASVAAREANGISLHPRKDAS